MIGYHVVSSTPAPWTAASQRRWSLGLMLPDGLIDRLDEYCWFAMDYQSGPIDEYRAAEEMGEEAVAALYVDVPDETASELAGAVVLFRKGTFRTLSAYLFPDDATLIGFRDDPADVMKRLGELVAASTAPFRSRTIETIEGRRSFWLLAEGMSQAIVRVWGPNEITVLCDAPEVLATLQGLAQSPDLELRQADIATLLGPTADASSSTAMC